MKSGIFAVFKSTTGTVFGGYTSRYFTARPPGWMSDPEAFLFSLTKEVTLRPARASSGVQHWSSGMIIVWDDMKLRNNCSIEVNLGDAYDVPLGYEANDELSIELFGGVKSIETSDIEIFQVTFQ